MMMKPSMTDKQEPISRWSFSFCPAPPDWRLDWEGIQAQFSWIRAMQGVPQDPSITPRAMFSFTRAWLPKR